jgi:alpha-beta hydrolase superfamily lysophospholipase
MDQPKAVVGIIHGFTKHTGMYGQMAYLLNTKGFAATAYDLPGHGKTIG